MLQVFNGSVTLLKEFSDKFVKHYYEAFDRSRKPRGTNWQLLWQFCSPEVVQKVQVTKL